MKTKHNLLSKEFKVNENFSISRGDYENMPIPMFAWKWSDFQMAKLANLIAAELSQYKYANQDKDAMQEEMDDAFWKEMEDCAVRMGMEYYEDLPLKTYNEINKEFANLK